VLDGRAGQSASEDGIRPMTSGLPVRLPVLFMGHGSPMNAIEDNEWSRAFRALGARLPRPRAILCVSAHWFVPATLLTANEYPETLHDFSGFPPALFAAQYPAAGDVGLARRVRGLLGAERAALSTDWGLDHGTWSVLLHLYPAADLPVVQLSIDLRLPPAEHLALGRALAPLREEGVLVLGSGNLVHNLGHALRSHARGDLSTPGWAEAFDAAAADAIVRHDHGFLVHALEGEAGRRSHPTPDHYLPLLYAVGAAGGSGPVDFPVTGFDLGSLSMRSVLFG
jgi:4,5-DOPA dioxygenase extradiol